MRRAPFVLLLFAGFAMAQGAPESAASPERLQALLKELAGLEPKAWAARIAALEAQAAESERNAKALRAEIARLEELRRLLAASPASRPSSAAASKPASKPVERPASVPRAAPGPVAELVTFDKQVGRIFEEHCTSCHDLDDKKGGLDLSTFAGVRQGGGSGRTVVPGDPEQSRLWRMVAREERPFMPKDADPLSREVLQTLRTWIEQGAAEDAAAARAFLAKKDAAAKPAATTAPVLAETGPLPEGLPKVPVTTGVRPAPIHCLVRSPRAPLLAMPGLRQVLFFDTALRPLGVLATPFAHVGAVAFAGDGTLLAAAGGEPGKSGRAQVFDVRSGAVRATVGAERDVPLAVAVHAGLGLVALGGAGKSVKAFRLADGGEVFSGKHEDFVLALAFSDDGALLAAADRSGAVQVWETKGGRLLSTLAGHKGAVHAVAFQPGSRALVSTGADGTLRGWDVAEGKEVWKQQAHQGEALAAAFGPSDRLASAGSDGVVKVWTNAGKPVATSPAAGEWLYALAFGGNGDTVIAGDWLGRPQRFEVASKRMQALPSPLQSAQ